MSITLPAMVMISFGSPIEPRRCSYPGLDRPEVTDPPLDVDELPGLLMGWRLRSGGWYGQVTYRYPVHGYGLALRYVDWFPAAQLRPSGDGGRAATRGSLIAGVGVHMATLSTRP